MTQLCEKIEDAQFDPKCGAFQDLADALSELQQHVVKYTSKKDSVSGQLGLYLSSKTWKKKFEESFGKIEQYRRELMEAIVGDTFQVVRELSDQLSESLREKVRAPSCAAHVVVEVGERLRGPQRG